MFYETFTMLCNNKGISPTATLQKIGVSTSKLTAWKNGSTPSVAVLILISEFFNVSIDYLIYGKEDKLVVQQKEVHQINGREKELLKYFRELSDEEQIRLVARAEVLAEQAKLEENVG